MAKDDGIVAVENISDELPAVSQDLGKEEDTPSAMPVKKMERPVIDNTTELNSTVYFCRINNNEYNYSANPTYLSESKIRVKNNQIDAPVSYITTVGLYSPDKELLAVAL